MPSSRLPSRPSSAPDFLLSRTSGSVRTQGVERTFTDVREASAALTRGEVEMVVGALPFNKAEPAALTVPASIIREPGILNPHPYYREGPGAVLHARVAGVDPSPEEHLRRVALTVDEIRRTALEKVVLARAVDIAFDPPVDPRLVAARLIDLAASGDGFIADLSPAGRDGHFLVGSSPEVLVKRQGVRVSSYPLAGSAARKIDDPVADAAAGERLASSAKDLEEHRFVVEHIRDILAPFCTELTVPARPILEKTNEMWHLATPIAGILRESPTTPAPSALELAEMLYPTPAVCGTPQDIAAKMILQTESDRGFYAGAVGYTDASGDGEYMVAIRCAEVNGAGNQARAWAGGGLVASSDPRSELDETTAKLRTISRALSL
ncbi:isochorismate synthase [Corynebacterium glaucum]|uniref:isochorismate synthase n=1 Tax=Corynebacterium glaucum TaxID=187491 RepID=UPI0025B59C4F|nr:chorismate-binding protein [Corynebacterium glaucum]WJZ07610.1 Isochorismate synthase DhbC [Corynebacterium glaucum]